MGEFEVSEMKYTQSHEWIAVEGDTATVGITDHAQKELGDIVYVELPIEGHTVKQGEEIIVLESTKAAVDIYTPVSGEITAVNTSLREYPEKVNHTAESEGWLFKIKMHKTQELDPLMDADTYHTYIQNLSRS